MPKKSRNLAKGLSKLLDSTRQGKVAGHQAIDSETKQYVKRFLVLGAKQLLFNDLYGVVSSKNCLRSMTTKPDNVLHSNANLASLVADFLRRRAKERRYSANAEAHIALLN